MTPNHSQLPDKPPPRRRWRGLPELVLTAAFSGFVVWHVMATRLPEEARVLETRFGSERNSEGIEEWIIRDFFQGRRDGFFVDGGANHFRKHSNSYFLETALKWSGIAIESLAAFAAEYEQFTGNAFPLVLRVGRVERECEALPCCAATTW